MKVNIGNYPKDYSKERKVSVEIKDYDVWSLNDTLALIIHPALILLKSKKQGSPSVDDADVPDELKSTSAPAKENDYDIDDNHHKRWEYVLDEMIFAFNEVIQDRSLEMFSTGEHDIVWTPVDSLGNEIKDKSKADFFQMNRGPKDTYYLDRENYDKFEARISNGLRLFGVYYQSLWN